MALLNQSSIDPNRHKTLIGVSTIDDTTLYPFTGIPLGSNTVFALTTAIVDASGNQITSFGGGTQYANGTSVVTPTGTVALGYDGANVRALSTDNSGLLKANITAIGGTALNLGQQTAANSIPVILPSATITTLTPPSNTGYALDSSLSTINTSINTLLKPASTLAAVTTVSAVTAITNALPAGTNLLGKVGIDQTTVGTTNAVSLAQIGANTVLSGNGTSGTGAQRVTLSSDNTAVANWGQGATASAVPSGAVYNGAQARSSEPTAATNGNMVGLSADLVGKLIVSPYANKENFISGTASATGTTGTSVIAAQGAGVKIYITSISIANTGSTTSLLSIQSDPAGTPTTLWQLINPSGGGDNITFPNPLVVAANKAVGFTAGSASTTQYVSISGYIGS